MADRQSQKGNSFAIHLGIGLGAITYAGLTTWAWESTSEEVDK
jgi:hypothetical protein